VRKPYPVIARGDRFSGYSMGEACTTKTPLSQVRWGFFMKRRERLKRCWCQGRNRKIPAIALLEHVCGILPVQIPPEIPPGGGACQKERAKAYWRTRHTAVGRVRPIVLKNPVSDTGAVVFGRATGALSVLSDRNPAGDLPAMRFKRMPIPLSPALASTALPFVANSVQSPPARTHHGRLRVLAAGADPAS